MTLEQGRWKLRKKWREILDDLDPREVCHHLYQAKVLTQDDMEFINEERNGSKKRCRHLLLKVFLDKNPDTIHKFFEWLSEKDYHHLCTGIHHQESSALEEDEDDDDDDDDDADKTLRESEMAEISRAIAVDDVWQDIGILAGGLTLGEVNSIESNPNPTLRPMKMLLLWRSNAAEKVANVRPLTRREVNAVLADIDCDVRV